VTPVRGADQPLAFKLWAPGALLSAGTFGVAEPAEDAQTVIPDLILTPLLAFDRRGGRLGYGAGHFDRTLEALRAHGHGRAIGLAYAEQEVDRVPTGRHDQTLDAILTEKGYRAVKEDF
jgi:5-formyltetrahydrofolate cyclo-ligase